MDAGAEQMAPLYPWVDQLDVGQVEQGCLLGEGSFGVVRAAKTSKHTECALKLVRPEAPPYVRWATAQEANVMARLSGHRFVLKMHTAVVEPGDPPRVIGYITELARFGSLSTFLQRHRQSVPDMVLMSLRIADGVGYVHENGHLHLDLKPDNVLLAHDELLGMVPKVGDFGLAVSDYVEGAVVSVGGFRGTPAYASPEMTETRGQLITSATDVYSLGCVFAGMAAHVVRAGPPRLRHALEAFQVLVDACKEYLPRDRPSLPAIKRRLQAILDICG
jgi:serine/threonine protein kinase